MFGRPLSRWIPLGYHKVILVVHSSCSLLFSLHILHITILDIGFCGLPLISAISVQCIQTFYISCWLLLAWNFCNLEYRYYFFFIIQVSHPYDVICSMHWSIDIFFRDSDITEYDMNFVQMVFELIWFFCLFDLYHNILLGHFWENFLHHSNE